MSDQPLLFRSVGVAQNGTTYYVDGEGGNNANDGQSPASAWRDFEKVNQTEFQPGDHLLLNAQSTGITNCCIQREWDSGTKDCH